MTATCQTPADAAQLCRTEQSGPISISFAVSDSYAQHLAVVITSILYHNPDSDFIFHVLHRDFSEENQRRVRALEMKNEELRMKNCGVASPPALQLQLKTPTRSIKILFHKVDASVFEKFPIPPGLEHVTRETYFRYLLPEILQDETRTIYSDVDVLFVADIKEIWNVSLDGHIMAAVRNYDGEARGDRNDIIKFGFSPNSPYFFTGFLVMDLDAMRKGNYAKKLMDATAAHGKDVTYIDLDITNLVCEGKIKEVSAIWNEVHRYSFLRRDVKIWHFPGYTQKPWCNIWKNYTWIPYFKYLLKSPYRANAARFIWGHIKGFFWFSYTKKGITRCLLCGIRVWKSRKSATGNEGASTGNAGSVMPGPISISFAVSDSYAQHLAVVITSILYHNPDSDFIFHVLHRDFSDENQKRVRELENFNNARHVKIVFHKVDASAFEKFPIPPELEHVTQEMYYRYVLPDVLADEDRTIYSDVDVLCVGDLRPLWELNLKGNIIAAVSEGESGEFKKKLMNLAGDAPYFYSGLLVMDLKAMRDGGYPARLMENTAKHAKKIAWPDQDIINLTFRDKILQLSDEWDGINVRYSPWRKGIVIWHFPGFTMKPWCNIWKNTTWSIYFKYLLKSPYRANAARFIWGHIKGFFWFSYTKKGITRYLLCCVRVWKRRAA